MNLNAFNRKPEAAPKGSRITAARAAALLHAAIGNELAIDRLTSQGYDLGIIEPIPRPLRLPKILKRWPKFQTVLLTALEIAWPLAGSALVCVQAVRARRDAARGAPLTLPKPGSFVIVSNLPNQTIVTGCVTLPSKRMWLQLPGITPGIPAGEERIAVSSLTVHGEIAWAWRLALREQWRRPRRGRGARLQTYVAFPFFLTFRIIERLASDASKTIVFTQQLDRWAVLLDGAKGPAPRWFIQHGRLGIFMQGTDGTLRLTPPEYARRMHRVAVVADFSDRDREIIKRHMLAFPDRPRFDRNSRGAGLELIKLPQMPGRSRTILFIGEPVRIDKQVAFLERLAAVLPNDVQILLKPHPRYPATSYKVRLDTLQNVTILTNPHQYPKADLVVYTISFLGDQYDSLGEPVAIVTLDGIEHAVTLVLHRLERERVRAQDST